MSRLICAAIVLVAAPVHGEEKALPKGAPPRVVSVISVDTKAEVIEYREPFPGIVVPEKSGPVKPGDPAKPPIVSPLFVTIKFSLRDGTVYDTDGKKVDKDVVAKRLMKGDIVLVSSDSSPVDPAYMKVFAKDVLILVHPMPGPGPALPILPGKKEK